ncbi:MAG: hypothetical protein GQ475_03665 [Methylococcaceae bacterium]|nr:hypothetical protein [Methylococcaceae bacterium]
MISSTSFSTESTELLQARGLSETQITDFASLLEEAHEQRENNISAKEVLNNMSKSELQLLQTATSLAAPINVNSLSKEGAINLLAQPDKTGLVDLNNDGIVEVGAARNMVFPPVNSPAHVKDAWDKATEDLSFFDKAVLELNLHVSIYGVEINGMSTKQPLTPEQQWSSANLVEWFATLRGGLERSVQDEGWTEHNKVTRDVYDKFESFLTY